MKIPVLIRSLLKACAVSQRTVIDLISFGASPRSPGACSSFFLHPWCSHSSSSPAGETSPSTLEGSGIHSRKSQTF